MDIKRSSIVLIGVLIIFSSTISIASKTIEIIPTSWSDKGNLHTSATDNILVDKVYNFTINNPYVIFDNNIFFEKPFYYNIYVCVVTPHTCDLNITIYDPEGDPYEIFYGDNMTQDDTKMIPFGAALSGNYTIIFEVILFRNLNINIKIEKWIKCLYDSIAPEEQQKMKHYDVHKFQNGNTINFNTTFRSDCYYKFYFQRVSPISIKLNPIVLMDHDIVSSNDIPYIIYRNEPVGMNVTIYRFGTAVEGQYIMNITIQCIVPCVNIAFAVVEQYQITDEIDPNGPEPPPVEPTNSNQSGIVVSIPPEFMVGTIGFFGCVVGIPILIIVVRKRKNSM